MKEVIWKFFKSLFLSKKGISWLVAISMQVFLTIYLAFFAPFATPEKVKMVFWLVLANMLCQLIYTGFITFHEIKLSYEKK